jgi:apolipoprotein N-acyltransferase
MYAKLHTQWWVLPALSGALLIGTFHPFDVWPLGFVALAPLYYFAGGFAHRRRIIFGGGFITGGLFSFFLSYYTIMQFHWLPEAYLFVGIVRLLVVPITLVGGSLCGLSMVAYGTLRSKSALYNALIAAALYTLSEMVLGLLFGGYYLGLLAYAAVSVPFLLSLASIGGAHLLSFVLAFISGFLAEVCIEWPARRVVLARVAGVVVIVAALVLVPTWWYLHRPLPVQKTLSVVVLQDGARTSVPFGTEKDGVFSWSMGPRLTQAASSSPDLLIYPFSPVEGALYRSQAPVFNKDVLVASESSVARFMTATLPAHTALMTWNNLYTDGHFYNTYELWQGGRVVSQYQKRALFPFMDYTPAWAQRVGLFSTPFDVVPGAPDNRLTLDGVELGDLMCSELHNTALARSEARRAPLSIAVGSEAMFQDDVASAFSLKAAQLRAAENDVPLIRGNILGPSGIINRFGELEASAPAGVSTSIASLVELTAPRQTLYNLFGEWIIYAVVCGILGSAWYRRFLKR